MENSDGSYDIQFLQLENDPEYLARQSRLFQRFFSVNELEDITLATRDIVDSTVRQTLGRAFDRNVSRGIKWFSNIDQYPIGYCNDITHLVEAILRWGCHPAPTLQASSLTRVLASNFSQWNSEGPNEMESPTKAKMQSGLLLPQNELSGKIARFEKAGGVFGSVWGIRPSEPSFHWSILIGDHVIDTAGDAMDRLAYPISVEPLDSTKFRSIRNYLDYARVAREYWGYDMYRNTLLPSIAPAFPLISVDRLGRIRFERPAILLKKSTLNRFGLSRQAWDCKAFRDPPKIMQESLWGILPEMETSIDQVFENWAQAAAEAENTERPQYLGSMFQRALYLAQKLEHDWQNDIGSRMRNTSDT